MWYSYVESDEPNDENIANHKAGAGLTYKYDDYLSLSLNTKFSSDVETEAVINAAGNTDFVEIDAYNTTDLIINYDDVFKWNNDKKSFDLRLSVYNIFDQDNTYPNVRGNDPVQFLDEERSFFLKATMKF